MSDMFGLVSALSSAGPPAPLRLRQGVIVSVAADTTATVTIGGSTTEISGVKVASHTCPIPGATCWLATDGRDWFVLATLAPTGPAWGAMRKSSTQSIPHDTWTDLTWSSRADTASSGVTLTSTGLQVIVPGLYHVTGSVDFTANNNGQRHCQISVNSNTIIQGTGGDHASGGDISRLRADGLLRLTIGDIVNLTVYQSSTTPLTTVSGAGYNMIRMVWIGPSS